MQNTETKKSPSPTYVVTGKIRLSYLNVFEPKAAEGSTEKKYSASIIISKDDKETLAKIKKAVDAAIEEGKQSKFAGKTKNLKTPLRDGDEERDQDEAYENCFFFNASSKRKPGLVDKQLNEIIDPADLYSGCYARVAVNFYPFNFNGKVGVAAGLQNIQKISDGEALSGGRSASEDFAAIEDEDEDIM